MLRITRCTLQQSYHLRPHSPSADCSQILHDCICVERNCMRATIGRLSRLLLACGLIYGALHLAACRSDSGAPAADTKADHSALLAGLPLDFVENRGQWDLPARF